MNCDVWAGARHAVRGTRAVTDVPGSAGSTGGPAVGEAKALSGVKGRGQDNHTVALCERRLVCHGPTARRKGERTPSDTALEALACLRARVSRTAVTVAAPGLGGGVASPCTIRTVPALGPACEVETISPGRVGR